MSEDNTIIIHCRCEECNTCNHIVANLGHDEEPTQADIDTGQHIALGSDEFYTLPTPVLKLVSDMLPLICEECNAEMPFNLIVVAAHDISQPTTTVH